MECWYHYQRLEADRVQTKKQFRLDKQSLWSTKTKGGGLTCHIYKDMAA